MLNNTMPRTNSTTLKIYRAIRLDKRPVAPLELPTQCVNVGDRTKAVERVRERVRKMHNCLMHKIICRVGVWNGDDDAGHCSKFSSAAMRHLEREVYNLDNFSHIGCDFVV